MSGEGWEASDGSPERQPTTRETKLSENAKVWLVTGASSGFGRAIAQAAVAAGDTVIGTARRIEALDDLVAAYPDRAEAISMDVTDGERVDAVAADVLARYGRVDVVVNNAAAPRSGRSRRPPTGSCATCSSCTCSARRG